MGREGPCFHCGIENTPLWRNGPPEKPVLCNACGSRWRIRGTLDNYIPKHAAAYMVIGSNNNQVYQPGELPLEVKPVLPMGVKKPKLEAKVATDNNHSAGSEEDSNNKSSSGSAVSFSENYIQMESINGKEISGSFQPSTWNPHIPTKKRSVVEQHILSPIERLQRQLYNVLQEPEFSKLSDEEDVLVFQKSNSMSSAEIGLGAVLMESPDSSMENSHP